MWVRAQSLHRRQRSAPIFAHKVLPGGAAASSAAASAAFVTANPHCHDDGEEDVWVPVIRPRHAQRRAEDKQRVHFKLNPLPAIVSEQAESSGSDDESVRPYANRLNGWHVVAI